MTTEQPADIVHPYVERRPDVQGGRPVIKGSRFPISSIVQNHRRGLSVEEILREFPWLRPAEVYDALSYWHDHQQQMDQEIAAQIDLEAAMQTYPPNLRPAAHDRDEALSRRMCYAVQRLRRRIPACRLKRLTFQQPVTIIQFEDAGGNFTDVCARDKANTIKREMLAPSVHARIEEPNKSSCGPYERTDIATLGTIAECTGIREIVSSCRTAMLLADDVIDLTSEEGVLLMNQAILTQAIRTLFYQAAQRGTNVASHR